jgi:hypothetical protein
MPPYVEPVRASPTGGVLELLRYSNVVGSRW